MNEGDTYYTDGSFTPHKPDYAGWGVVYINSNNSVEKIKGVLKDPTMRNIDGEIRASVEAIKHALDNNLDYITIVHDYEGIGHWPNRNWRAKKTETQKYVDFVDGARKEMKIIFNWTRGHDGNEFNEVADNLAKEALDQV